MSGSHVVEDGAADMRIAVRRLRKRLGFTLAATTVIAIGIGATTAVFSAIDAAILRPLPFVRPSEIVTLPGIEIPFNAGVQRPSEVRRSLDITDVAEMTDVFSNVGAYAAGALNLVDPVNPQRVRVGVVTPTFFGTLGVAPQLGRTFQDAEGQLGSPHVVVLSDALWSQRYGRSDVLGKPVELSGTAYTVVGIMPRGFSFPDESDLWIPLTIPTTFESFIPFRGFLPARVIARTRPGVSVELASSRMLARWTQVIGQSEGVGGSRLETVRARGTARSLQRELVGDRRTALTILMGTTGILLLIACANTANLLQSETVGRRREIAVRQALGASQNRIVRQLLVESVLLALAGAAVGVMLALAIMGVLRGVMPFALAGVAQAELNVRVLTFAVLLAIVTAAVFGLWPALSAARVDPAPLIKAGGSLGATMGGLGHSRKVVIAAAVALTVVLLVGSGLALRSLQHVLSQNLGMDPEHVGTLELSLQRGMQPERVTKLRAIVERLELDPAIDGAAVVNELPLRGSGGIALSVFVDDPRDTGLGANLQFAEYLLVTGGYFGTLDIPLLRGRTFNASDNSSALPVAVISATMADLWSDSEALGNTFRIAGDSLPVTVIGVVGDVRRSIERAVRPQMYLPIEREAPTHATVLARSRLAPTALLPRMTNAVRMVDSSQAVYNVRPMQAVVSAAMVQRRTSTLLISIFGAVGLVLSAVGVYAVVSHSITRRRREFGIRFALGAGRRSILALIGREIAVVLLVGLTIGMVGAWLVTRAMAAILFQVDAHDVATFLTVPLVIGVSVAVATIIPARRAMLANPSEVMRME